MEPIAARLAVLAQRSGIDELVNTVGADFRDRQVRYSTTDVLLGMLAVLVLFVVIVLGARALEAMRRRLRGSRRWLFWRLCREHRLGIGDSLLLWRLARSRRLKEPAQLFVQPEHFDSATLPLGVQGRAGRLIELQAALFALPEPDPRPPVLVGDGPRDRGRDPQEPSPAPKENPAIVFDVSAWQGMLPAGENLKL